METHLDSLRDLVIAPGRHLLQTFLEVLGPGPDRQFRNVQRFVIDLLNDTAGLVSVLLYALDRALPVSLWTSLNLYGSL